MNGRRAKEIRRAMHELLKIQGDMVPMGYKKTAHGKIVSPRRTFYQHLKKAVQILRVRTVQIMPTVLRIRLVAR